ncbi:DUF2147 domain-containing protein [Nibribacter ruber]|uniref:DUF2147 domain-containing protein n=1 Tax=Nibribacter ruber TaxID=2698458 RepID=A0A6P1NW22_9BACT|nr:DUF2147 domain-containing protein [Nibribacter ruber]QHL86524.1 DUF2147 domain-containing protein [Nibribacter ruber]
MKKFFLLALFLCLATLGWAQKGSPIGTWTNEEKDARFEIYQCGDKLCGKITWLKEPNRDGKPKVDQFNPDPKLQKRPIMGLVFLKGFEPDEAGKWDDGTIYDPKSGKTYSSYMKVLSKDKLEVKGYIGISLIGRSQTWTRVN